MGVANNSQGRILLAIPAPMYDKGDDLGRAYDPVGS